MLLFAQQYFVCIIFPFLILDEKRKGAVQSESTTNGLGLDVMLKNIFLSLSLSLM